MSELRFSKTFSLLPPVEKVHLKGSWRELQLLYGASSMAFEPQQVRERNEIQNYQWFEQEKGRDLSWAEAWYEWAQTHRQDLGQFLKRGSSES